MANPWDNDVAQSTPANPWDKDVTSGATPPAVQPKPSFWQREFPNMTAGVKQILGTEVEGHRDPTTMANDAVEGAGKVALPFAIGAGLANPLSAAAALAGGFAGGAGAAKLASMAHASPGLQELAGNAGSIVGGGLGGRAVSPLQGVGRSMFANAYRLPSQESADAVMNNTSAVRPKTMFEQTGKVIGKATQDRDAALSGALRDPSLQPGKDSLLSSATRQISGQTTPTDLTPMFEHLTMPSSYQAPGGPTIQFPGRVTPGTFPATSTGNPSAVSQLQNLQDPSDFLNIRGRFGRDFTKFQHTKPLSDDALKAGNDAYMALTNEFHDAVPGAIAPDDLIHNVVPARASAETLMKAPGMVRGLISRGVARTGALAGPLFMGQAGNIPGAAGILTAQESMADPSVMSLLGRATRAAGRPLPIYRGAVVAGSRPGDQQ